MYAIRSYYEQDAGQDNGSLKIYGTIDIRDANLAFTEQERLTEVLVDEGDSVAAGVITSYSIHYTKLYDPKILGAQYKGLEIFFPIYLILAKIDN